MFDLFFSLFCFICIFLLLLVAPSLFLSFSHEDFVDDFFQRKNREYYSSVLPIIASSA